MIISFDFDDTLTKANVTQDGTVAYGPRAEYIQKLKDYAAAGNTIYIVTARQDIMRNRELIQNFVKENELPVTKVFFTSHMPKGPILASLQVDLHVDDKIEELESAKRHGIKTEEAPFIPCLRPTPTLDGRRMKRL